jgi:hypothetical protein
MFLFKLANTSRVIYGQKWLTMFEHGCNVALSFYVWFAKRLKKGMGYESRAQKGDHLTNMSVALHIWWSREIILWKFFLARLRIQIQSRPATIMSDTDLEAVGGQCYRHKIPYGLLFSRLMKSAPVWGQFLTIDW